MTMVQKHLAEIVNFGGLRVTRGEMIRQLTETAKATGRTDWQSLVNAYLGGHSMMEKRKIPV